tara:strand:- start:4005 stop:4301 length:297 start_codon:yes stop_codon:yes gene_type:complete
MARTTGAFSGTGNSDEIGLGGDFTVSLGGTFVGTVIVERTFDGVVWFLVDTLTVAGSLSGVGSGSYQAPAGTSPSGQPRYRLRCSAFTSGPIEYFLGD